MRLHGNCGRLRIRRLCARDIDLWTRPVVVRPSPAAVAASRWSDHVAGSTMSAATRTALTMAVADDEPWLMMQTPSTPEQHGAAGVLGVELRRRAGAAPAAARRPPPGSSSVGAERARAWRSTRARMPPSRVLRATLPVKPSVTTTSTSSVMRSRPSTLPTKVPPVEPIQRPVGQQLVGLLDQRVALGGLLADGQQRRPWGGRCRSGRGRTPRPSGRTAPATRRWHSALAPASSSTVGVPPGTGIGVAMAGRATPLMRPMRSSARGHGGAGVAGADHGRRLAVAHRLGGPHQRRVLHASHARPGVGVHGDDLGRRRSPRGRRSVAELLGPADQHDGDAELGGGPHGALRRSRRAPCRRPWRRRRWAASAHAVAGSVDVDGLAAVVPAAVAAHDVGQLGGAAAGQMLRAGALSVQADARRLRLFDLEVFFLGTAISRSRSLPCGSLARVRLVAGASLAAAPDPASRTR